MEWLEPQNIIALIAAVLTGIGGSALVKAHYDRKKTAAEARNMDITGDMSLGKGWQEYAEQQKKDKEELARQFKEQTAELTKKFEEVLAVKEAIITGLSETNKKITEQNTILLTEKRTLTTANEKLTGQVESLLRELGKYTGMEQKIDTAAGKLHEEIDHAADSLKNPEKTHG